MIGEVLIEAVGAVAEFVVDLLPDWGSDKEKASDQPKPVPSSEYEQRPPTGPFEER